MSHAKFNVTQGKNWDRSGALGAWLVPFNDAAQLDEARIITRVKGEVLQDENLNRMVFSVRDIVAYLTTFMNLQAGDVIITGTPTGDSALFASPRYLRPGDEVEVDVSDIGTHKNWIEDEIL